MKTLAVEFEAIGRDAEGFDQNVLIMASNIEEARREAEVWADEEFLSIQSVRPT